MSEISSPGSCSQKSSVIESSRGKERYYVTLGGPSGNGAPIVSESNRSQKNPVIVTTFHATNLRRAFPLSWRRKSDSAHSGIHSESLRCSQTWEDFQSIWIFRSGCVQLAQKCRTTVEICEEIYLGRVSLRNMVLYTLVHGSIRIILVDVACPFCRKLLRYDLDWYCIICCSKQHVFPGNFWNFGCTRFVQRSTPSVIHLILGLNQAKRYYFAI